MQNMGNTICKHSNKLLFQSLEQPTRMCNCRDKASCLSGQEQSPKVFCISGTSRQHKFKKLLPWNV